MRLIFLNNPQPNQQEKQYIHNVNQHITQQKPLVIYFYREGCPYCIQTSKEWMNIKQYIERKNNDLLFVEANGELYELMQNVGEKPVIYPTIRFIHKNNVIPFTKEGPQRNAYTMAKWIESISSPIKSSPTSPYSMNVNLSNQFRSSSPNLRMNFSNDSENGSIENDDTFTSTKFPPFSNQLVAEKMDTPFIQMKISSPLKSRRKKRKSLYSRVKKNRKKLYKTPSYRPRFLTTRRKHLRNKTQMF